MFLRVGSLDNSVNEREVSCIEVKPPCNSGIHHKKKSQVRRPDAILIFLLMFVAPIQMFVPICLIVSL